MSLSIFYKFNYRLVISSMWSFSVMWPHFGGRKTHHSDSTGISSGVGTVVAVATLAATLFSPDIKLPNPFKVYSRAVSLMQENGIILLRTGVCFWKLHCPHRNLQKFYAMLCAAQHGLHTYNLLPTPLY